MVLVALGLLEEGAVALDVVDEHADALDDRVLVGGRVVDGRHDPLELDAEVAARHVLDARLAEQRRQRVRDGTVVREQDGREAVARDAVDQQAEEEALVGERGPRLHGCEGQEDEGERVGRSLKLDAGEEDGGQDQGGEEGSVQAHEARKAALAP